MVENDGDTEVPQGEENLGLEERLRRLEEIVGTLESDGVELDRAMQLFEEGVRHLRMAEETLATAELKVQELIGEGEDAELRDFEGGSSG